MILLSNGDLNEAKSFATRAVELSPSSASYLDTLARIQARQGDRDGAIATFQKALNLQPDSLEAMIGLASTLVDAGQRESAATLLSQINTLVKGRQRLSPQLQRELDLLRATVKVSL
jgi:Flp pilus assembly protein TadD